MAERTLRINVVVDHKNADRRLGNVNRQLQQTGAVAAGAAVGTSRLAASLGAVAVRAVGVTALASAAAQLARTAIGMNAQLEKSTLVFQTLTGDAGRAEEHVRSLFTFAQRTPFETQPIIEASRLMQTFGGDALNTSHNLTLIGDAAAATTQPIDQLAFWVGRLFSALQGGQPIGEATMRLMEMGVIAPGVVAELREMAKGGADASETWGLFEEQLLKFNGAMELQAETFGGLVSSLGDSTSILIGRVGEPLFNATKRGLKEANESINAFTRAWDTWLRVDDLAQRAIRGDIRALGDLTHALGQTTAEFSETEAGMEDFERAARAAREAVSGPVGLDLGVTSAMQALEEFEPHAVRINEETERMGREAAAAAEAVEASQRAIDDLRRAEEQLLVVQPRLNLSFHEMLDIGTRLSGPAGIPVLESRTIDLTGAMMGSGGLGEAIVNTGGSLMGEFGPNGRAREAIVGFERVLNAPGGVFGSIAGGLAGNVLSWADWGFGVIQEINKVDGRAQGLLSTLGNIVGFAGGAAAIGIGAALTGFLIGRKNPQGPTGGDTGDFAPGPDQQPGETGEGPIGMARGGFGTVTRPTLFLAGEAGPEQVAFSGANRRFSGAGTTLNLTFNGFSGSQRDAERITRMVERSINRQLGSRRVIAGVV